MRKYVSCSISYVSYSSGFTSIVFDLRELPKLQRKYVGNWHVLYGDVAAFIFGNPIGLEEDGRIFIKIDDNKVYGTQHVDTYSVGFLIFGDRRILPIPFSDFMLEKVNEAMLPSFNPTIIVPADESYVTRMFFFDSWQSGELPLLTPSFFYAEGNFQGIGGYAQLDNTDYFVCYYDYFTDSKPKLRFGKPLVGVQSKDFPLSTVYDPQTGLTITTERLDRWGVIIVEGKYASISNYIDDKINALPVAPK